MTDEEIMAMVFMQFMETHDPAEEIGACFLQHYFHEGIKKFGKVGEEAAFGELKQLHQ